MELGLNELGNLGELISAIAVVVSVLYLAFELRSNTRSVRAVSAAQSQDSLVTINDLIASEGELASLMTEALAAESLDGFSAVDRFRIDLLLRGNMQRFEAMFFRYEAGMLEERIWDVRRTWLAGFIQLPAVAQWWNNERSSSLFTRMFIEDIEASEGIRLGPTGQRLG